METEFTLTPHLLSLTGLLVTAPRILGSDSVCARVYVPGSVRGCVCICTRVGVCIYRGPSEYTCLYTCWIVWVWIRYAHTGARSRVRVCIYVQPPSPKAPTRIHKPRPHSDQRRFLIHRIQPGLCPRPRPPRRHGRWAAAAAGDPVALSDLLAASRGSPSHLSVPHLFSYFSFVNFFYVIFLLIPFSCHLLQLLLFALFSFFSSAPCLWMADLFLNFGVD